MTLQQNDIDFFHENGFLRIPNVFTPEEMDEMEEAFSRLVLEWSMTTPGWSGPWRRVYMDKATEQMCKVTYLHDLHLYSEAWMRAVTRRNLVRAIADLIGPDVELHHSTMHIKPPQTGHPFPMHQDHPFYAHADGRYVDALVHLDDTNADNGEIRYLRGSHKNGALKHVTETEDGPCSPHLPTDDYHLEDTVAVPANRGDVVCFSIHTVHGSYINKSDKPRRLVRVGYRNPHNDQTAGQSLGRPGILVTGFRQRRKDEELLKQT